jgi:hypothetical protein
MIELIWPPSTLSGHNTGHYRAKADIIRKHRLWAKNATLAAKIRVPIAGDIRLIVTFYPPDRRGDRVNFPNRCKPLFDGIADALKVNDSRFLPSYFFAEPVKNPRVTISIGEG